jgi:hypothetical protein
MTNVPAIQITQTGLVIPTEPALLAGAQADLNAAFGGNLSSNLETPQGQIASSEAAMLSAVNAAFLLLANNFDPAYASGRFQDGIGRYYMMTRNPPISTVLQISCSGLTGVVIPVGALVQDALQNIYSCTLAGTIPTGGSITLPFANNVSGPISIPSSVTIYQGPANWDSATLVSGVEGTAVESRIAFELRRQNSVQANSRNTNAAIQSAILAVPNVLSAYVTDNYQAYPIAKNPIAPIVGSISGTVLTVTSGSGILPGMYISGAPGLINGLYIVSNGTGTGGSGTYNINASQTLASTTLQIGGVQINSNSLYACVSGGLAQSVANALWTKKPPGCGYTGNTSATVYDTSTPYGSPGIPYSVNFRTAVNLPIFLAVNLKNNAGVPSNALALVQTAITNAFAGVDGGLPAQIGINVISSRFNAGILALGSWAQLLSIGMASSNDAPSVVCTGSISGATLTVTAIASGTLVPGMGLAGVNLSAGQTLGAQQTGTTGSTGTYLVSISQTAASATIDAYAVSNFQETILISQMPTTSAPYIALNLL